MRPEERVLKALASSEITCVALVDDAFDAPSIHEDHMGAFLDILGEINPKSMTDFGVDISDDQIALASQLIGNSEYTSESVIEVISKVFRVFISTNDDRLDPNGQFKALKGPNLAYVRPILSLLQKSNPPLKIVSCGSNASDYDAAIKEAQFIFMDFFLKAGLVADGEPDPEQLEDARKASVTRLKDLISQIDEENGIPTIVLMSSHDVENRIEEFQNELAATRGQIFASRFDFIQKKQFQFADKYVDVSAPALDVLLQLIQSFEFGFAMHMALRQWHKAASSSVEDVWHSLSQLKVKDFAYLMRFRLKDEGVHLSEYLDWLFSEYLSDAVSRRVDWRHPSFKVVDDPDGHASRILGAFDGPTGAIAKIFDCIRVEKPKDREKRNYRMGDLYQSIGHPERVYCLITPECDLVVRNGRMKAPRLLMVAGVLHDIHKSEASVWDFIEIDGQPKNIQWLPKDIVTYEKSKWAKPGNKGKKYRHLGTLRPMYAEDLRARVIAEYSRVGLNVAPTMNANRPSYLLIDGDESDIKLQLADEGMSTCSVIFPRSTFDQPKVIFYESVVAKIISTLAQVDTSLLKDDNAKKLTSLISKESVRSSLFDKLCSTGVTLPTDKPVSTIYVTAKPINRGGANRPWCQLVVVTD